jgi:DNA (cytosine-5)-methyltransferase 1
MMLDGLIIDSFAGGGGASLGIEMALGRSPDIAINHDAEAMAMHQANHPDTIHLSKNIWKVDPIEHIGRRKVALAWFSPDCKHFSKAKGGKPVARNIRDLAWVVVLWARQVRPSVIMLENVEEFRTWGPLDANDMPCPVRKGQTFKRWVGELRKLGYKVDWRELRACDYGAPTIRKRLFLIARCDGQPIVWPSPTHGPGLIPYRTAAECIDWSLPCPSIFLTKEEGRAIGVNRPLAEATMARIARGVKRYVIDAAEPFIVSVSHGDSGGKREYPIEEPLGTLTQKNGHAIVMPMMSYGQQGGHSRPADKPMHTITASVKDTNQLLVAAFLAQHNGGMTGHDGRKPLSTVTQRGTQQALVAAHMLHMKGSAQSARSAEQPLASITAQGTHHAEVRAFLIKYYGSDQDPQLREPLHTVTTKDRFGLVMVHGEPYQIVDIGMRMLSPRELFRAQGFTESYKIDVIHNGKPLSKSSKVRMCGNSVSPVMACALVKANLLRSNLENMAAA